MRLMQFGLSRPKPPPSKAYAAFTGIVMPIVCVVFDPIVFKGDFFGLALLEHWRLASYATMLVACLAMGLTIVGLPRSAPAKAFVAGLLLGESFFALGLGLVIVPFSIIGLLFVFGVLGFTPFFCAKLYFGAGRRVIDAATALDSERRRWPLVVAGLLAFLVIAIGSQYSVEHATAVMIDRLGSTQGPVVEAAIADLKRWGWAMSATDMRSAFLRAPTEEVQENLRRGLEIVAPRALWGVD